VLVMRIRLPRVIHIQSTPARAVFATAALLWTVLASMTVRATLPLWADNIHLWQWAITEYPKSTVAIDNLIVAYMDNNDYQAARALAEKTANQGIHCPDCLLNDASSALALHDLGGADRALQQLRDYHELTWDRELFRSYLITTGDLLSAKGQYRDAVTVLRQATEMDPLVAEPQLSLGLALAADGDADEAHRVLTSALLLLPPDQRQSRTLSLDKAIKLNTAQAVRRGTSTLLPVK
jgi:tetratricopeptide (TPR) repeat protein